MLEGMLRVCALQYERSWDKSLPYAEFSYNNSYQESLKMAPFEMLYGHDAKPHYFGLRLENRRFLDLTYCKKPRSKFMLLRRTFMSHNRDKRATLIIGEGN
jgi:hypothetical protein